MAPSVWSCNLCNIWQANSSNLSECCKKLKNTIISRESSSIARNKAKLLYNIQHLQLNREIKEIVVRSTTSLPTCSLTSPNSISSINPLHPTDFYHSHTPTSTIISFTFITFITSITSITLNNSTIQLTSKG
jgi:hypothetical protein